MASSSDDQFGDKEKQDWRLTSGTRLLRKAPDRGSVPQGAVMLHKNEMADVMNRIINSWKPEKEM